MLSVARVVLAGLLLANVSSRAPPATPTANLPPRVHTVHTDGHGSKALVSDTLVAPASAQAVRSFASHFGDWRFVGPLSAAYRAPEIVAFDKKADEEWPLARDGFRFATDLHRPWIGRTSVAQALAEGASLISHFPGNASDWHLLHAAVVNVRRGDAVRIAAACPPPPKTEWSTIMVDGGTISPPSVCGNRSPGGVELTAACPGDVVGLIVLNAASNRPQQNDYAEITLFERMAASAQDPVGWVDSFAGFRLRPSRSVVFPCETPFRIAPPAIATPKAAMLLRVVLTRNASRATAAGNAAAMRHAARGNSLAERLGFPASLFPDEVVRLQQEAINAMEAEEHAATAADAAVEADDERGNQSDTHDEATTRSVGRDHGIAEDRADAKLQQALAASKAAEAAARALADEGDGWALPLSQAVNVSSHEMRVYETTGGRRVHVFDGLFASAESQAMLRQLRDHVVRNASYSFDDSTNEETQDDTDNVQWIVGLDESFVVRTKLWPMFRGVMDHVTPWQGFWPYDVSVNVIRSWDHTLVHADCSSSELEYTLLLYLNDDLGLDDGGETVFFDDVGNTESDAAALPDNTSSSGPESGHRARLLHRAARPGDLEFVPSGRDQFLAVASLSDEDDEDEDDEDAYGETEDDLPSAVTGKDKTDSHASQDNDDDGEEDEDDEGDESESGSTGSGYSSGPGSSDVLAVVRPVFGRVAIFNGNVPHSARPPYGTYPGIRYTLAVKMTSSRLSAVAKNLASNVHGTVDELQNKVNGDDIGEPETETAALQQRKDQWEDILEDADALHTEVSELKEQATASDGVQWSGSRPAAGQPWRTTSLTTGPPSMTSNPQHLARLLEITKLSHAIGEKVETGGWQEFAERLGLSEADQLEGGDM